MRSRWIHSSSERRDARLLLVALSVLSQAAVGERVLGQSAAGGPDPAQRHYRRGAALFEAGQYGQAYDEFKVGYDLSKRPLFLVNMAHAQRRQGFLDRARDLYRRYLLVAPDSPLRRQVESVIEEIEIAFADDAGTATGSTAPQRTREPSAAQTEMAPAAPVAPVAPPGPRAPGLEARPPTPALVRRGWFWVLAGSLLAGIVAVAWSSRPAPPDPGGTLGTLGHP